jgi:CRP-like cAMP-binding protein
VMVAEHSYPATSCLIVTGWAARAKLVEGGRRQITEFHLAGDFVDLHSFLIKQLDHEVITLTQCRVAVVPHEELRAITERLPHLTRLLWLGTLIDAAIHRSWLTAYGRMTAVQRIAHLLCELYVRLDVVGATEEGGFSLPLTQEEVGDACGLTSVHVNRMAQQMRGEGLLEWKRSRVTILDWERLKTLAMFDPTYLNLRQLPR